MRRLYLTFLFLCYALSPSQAQSRGGYERQLSLTEVIKLAYESSPSALIAMHNFRSSYWQFRSFRAQLLPSLNLNGNLGNYNRSLVSLQDAQTGEINYIPNNTLRNAMTLSIDQNIALTGGTISLYTYMDRLDQFSPQRRTTYNSQPINITYIQPLRSFNSLKWDKKIEPEEYERAKRTFLEAMESITINVTELYFNLWQTANGLNLAKSNYANTEKLLEIAKERFEIGSITKDDLLQLELRLLNEGLSINKYQLECNQAELTLKTFLGYNDLVNLIPKYTEELPDLHLDREMVLELAHQNSSFELQQQIQLLTAQRDVAEAKAKNGPQIVMRGQFGLTQQGSTFASSYNDPLSQQIVSLGITTPILDWGQAKGRIKMAKSKEEVIRTEIERAEMEFNQNILISVMQFNNQQYQCKISERADSIAHERYRLTAERFANGTISVIELNTAQSEKDQAAALHISELKNFWLYYYQIRKSTLYDYITQTNISAEFDRIIDN